MTDYRMIRTVMRRTGRIVVDRRREDGGYYLEVESDGGEDTVFEFDSEGTLESIF